MESQPPTLQSPPPSTTTTNPLDIPPIDMVFPFPPTTATTTTFTVSHFYTTYLSHLSTTTITTCPSTTITRSSNVSTFPFSTTISATLFHPHHATYPNTTTTVTPVQLQTIPFSPSSSAPSTRRKQPSPPPRSRRPLTRSRVTHSSNPRTKTTKGTPQILSSSSSSDSSSPESDPPIVPPTVRPSVSRSRKRPSSHSSKDKGPVSTSSPYLVVSGSATRVSPRGGNGSWTRPRSIDPEPFFRV